MEQRDVLTRGQIAIECAHATIRRTHRLPVPQAAQPLGNGLEGDRRIGERPRAEDAQG
jgi:hypothetical protein